VIALEDQLVPVTANGNAASSDVVLEVRELRTYFDTEEGEIRAVDGVTFTLRRGRILAVVGESGCGKSITSYSILRLLPKGGRFAGGKILLHPREGGPIDITALDEKSEQLYRVRGGLVSMIFQEPMTALSPVHTIGNQIMEAVLLHQNVGKARARELAIEALGKVGIPDPERRIGLYPHELSGGMRQRAVIAMALVCRPELLIGDEPTTALDVTIQAQILGLIKRLQAEIGCSVLLITHNMGVVAQIADEVAVMYLGRMVEQGLVERVLLAPRHPYTIGLMSSIPGAAGEQDRLYSIEGSVPSLTAVPPGCSFHPRCPWARTGLCDTGAPPPLRTIGRRQVACHLAEVIMAETEDAK
jgi:oligopeptide/dipeptide ABC transporter ATP-binding protein